MEPSRRVSLKGLKWDKGHREFYPGSAPLNEVKAYSCFRLYCLMFDYQGANTLGLVLDLLFLVLTRCWVTPLYTQVDTQRSTESRGRLIDVSGSVSALSILQHKFTY